MALFLRWILVFSLALFPIASHALALGKLKVNSALNEPLNAEIEFTSITEKELKGFVASLAARTDFDDAGIERPPFLSQIKFMVAKRTDGRYYLQLRTDEQIDEPFLHFLLQVDWPGGKLVREYTALIDPPYKIAGKAAPVETPVIEAPTPAAPVPELQAVPPSPAPSAESAPVEKPKEEIPPLAAKPEELKAPEQNVPPTEQVAPKEEVAKTEQTPAPEATAPEKPLGPPISAEQTPGVTPEEPASPKVEPLEAAPKAETAPETPAPPAEVVAEEKPAAVPAPAATAMSEYSVKRGDTLWVIADKTRADNKDVSVEQVILAIYRTNKDAFFGNNVNNLKAGKILKIPEREEINSVAGPQARREFRAQYDAWQEYKLKLAAASGAVKLSETPQAPTVAEAKPPAPTPPEPTKKPATKPAEATAPVAEKSRQDELLKIVRNTLQKDKSTPDKKVAEKESAKEAGANERQALAERAATLEESLESKRLENKELSEKIGLVRSQLKKESRLIELESQNLAQQKKPAETKPAEPPVKPAEKPAEKPAVVPPPPEKIAKQEEPVKVEPLAPAPKPAPTAAPRKKAPLPPPPQEEKGFLATLFEAIQSDLLVPVLIGVVVLVSGGIALIYFRRRQKSIAEFEESILSADAISTDQPATTGNVDSQQKQAVTTGGDTSFLSDFSQGGMGNIHTDEVDPIAEAEVYLAYGRDETAEEILKEAVVKNPDRQELKLKLLEIYHQRNDVSAFETLAEELYAALGGRGGKIWEKVEEMGRKLNPENPMFRGGAPAKGGSPKPKSPAPAAPAGGMQVNMPAPAATPTPKTEIVSGIDFDAGMPAAHGGKTESFDMGSLEDTQTPAADAFGTSTPKTSAKTDAGLDSLDFGAPADGGLDFDIGAKDELGGLDSTAVPTASDAEIKWEPAETPAAIIEAEEAAVPAAGNGENSAQWDETATKLDLAKAYIDMGDAEGARSILQEVMTEGSDAQKKQAQELSSQIG